MDVLRTPDSRFENLEGYPFVANYLDVAASDTQPLRMHFLDEGPIDGPPIVLLHGEPTWSYLYRTMIPLLADAGNRVLAPDLIGFGRSDKPSRIEDYTYLRHVEWLTSWFERLKLKRRHAVRPGLGIADRSAHRRRAGRSDRALGGGERVSSRRVSGAPLPPSSSWRAFARYSPVLPAGQIVAAGTVRRVRPKVRAGYDAPFPDKTYQAGARAFPQLVPTSPDRSGNSGQSCGVGGPGPVGEALSCHFRPSRSDPRPRGPSADQAHPGRSGPATRPHQCGPLHPGRQRTRIGRPRPVLAEGAALTTSPVLISRATPRMTTLLTA